MALRGSANAFFCWEELISLDNLWCAWRELERGKRRRPDVAAFGFFAERRVLTLGRLLREGQYHPGPYRILRVVDPKRRMIAAASVLDRLVHHAVHRVLAPRLNRRFIDHSYACLPGRGTHRALLHAQRGLRTHRFVLHLDIRRYFYSIDRGRLAELLWRSLPEPPLRALLQRILDSGAGLYSRPKVAQWLGWEAALPAQLGLPIGNLTSQWWGNLYLDGVDHHALRVLRVDAYQRYMDDLLVFGDDRERLLAQRDAIAQWLDAERGLSLKEPDARPQSTFAPLIYLGHRLSRDDMTLGKKALDRLPGHLSRVAHDPEKTRQVVASFAAAFAFGEDLSRGDDQSG